MKNPALVGFGRRDYAYDIYWVVFPLRTGSGGQLFQPEDQGAELSVRIYDKVGKVRWLIPDSIRNLFAQSRDRNAGMVTLHPDGSTCFIWPGIPKVSNIGPGSCALWIGRKICRLIWSGSVESW